MAHRPHLVLFLGGLLLLLGAAVLISAGWPPRDTTQPPAAVDRRTLLDAPTQPDVSSTPTASASVSSVAPDATRTGGPSATATLSSTTPTPPTPRPTPISTPLPSTFVVYTDDGAPGNHYVPSGLMGDYGAITLTQTWTGSPHSGATCIQVVYTGATPQSQGWAGVYWQDPANNWGTLPGGYDLSRYPHLSFWVRGEQGGEKVVFGVGGIPGSNGDSLQPAVSTGAITLTTSWQMVTLDLTGKNLSHIIGGFAWGASQADNPAGATFYLDDIVYSVR